MDYDQLLQYRERHNASWDRIRHENASSVRSEPADPTSYVLPNAGFHGTGHQNYQWDNIQNFHDQSLVLANNYNPVSHQIQHPIPIQQEQILDYTHLPNTQLVQVGVVPQNQNIPNNLEILEEEEFEEDDEDSEEEESEQGEEGEVEHPDVYCIDCDTKLDEPSLHDASACSRVKLTRFECSTCQKGFNHEKNLRIHKIVQHLKAIDFVRGTRCSFCSNDSFRTPFTRFTAYIGHLKIHLKPDVLNCDQCEREFENERDLDRHTRRDHSDDPYELIYCPKCQKIITFEEQKSHISLHSAVKAVQNRQAKRILKSSPIKKSKKRKPPERTRKFQCPECPKAFVRPAELSRHAAVHLRAKAAASSSLPIPKWKCAICSKEYSHEAGLQEHKRVAHGNAKRIICRVCGLVFTKKSNHDRHMSQIHPIDQDTKDGKKFECPDCPTVHSTLGALTRHKRTCHNQVAMKLQKTTTSTTVPPEQRHICRTCKREFREPEMLRKHSRLHVLSEHRWRDLQGGGERKCDYCDKSFVLRASLIWHQQKHFEPAGHSPGSPSNSQPYCTICDLNFYSNQEFRQHFDEQHTIYCGICQQKFTSRQVYEDHICNRKFAATSSKMNQLVPSNRVVICRLCRPPQRLTTYRQIKEHRARHHLPRKTHLCWTCHKSFRTAQLLSLHAEVHDRQPVQCSHCPQVFHSRVALKQHVRLTHGGDTNYQCVVHVDRTMAMSAQSFAEYGLAADHPDGNAHRAHSVTEWMDGAPEEEHIQTEQRENEHLQYQTLSNVALHAPIPNQVDQQPIRCEVCHHLYNNIDLLCDHWQASDTDNDHSYAFVTCPVCELRIRGAADAANHLRSAHLFARPRILSFMKPNENPPPPAHSNSMALAIPATTVNKKKHPCMHCTKAFTRKNDLARHMKIHTGEKEFECPTCHQTFREKSTLKNHLITHSDNPPQYQCTVCDKAFFERKTLVVHMRIHTGELPFKCRYCDLHYRTTAMARTHEKKCAYAGPQHPILPDPSLPGTSSAFQPQFVAGQADMNRTITQISTLPPQQLQLSRNTAFSAVQNTSENRIYVITKPITPMEYVVIVQKSKPAENAMRYAVDTVSEIKIDQLQESTNLSIVLHNEMRLNLNTVKMLQILHSLRPNETFKTRITVAQFGDENQQDLFSIIAHNKTSGSSFLRRCEICEVDLPTKRISDAHFYSEDHETAQLMYPSTSQAAISTVRNRGGANIVPAIETEFSCKLCGNLLMDMDSLLEHIRKEHDDPVVPPRPVAHTAPIN